MTPKLYKDVIVKSLCDDTIYEVRVVITNQRIGWITRGRIVGECNKMHLAHFNRWFVVGREDEMSFPSLEEAIMALRDYTLHLNKIHKAEQDLCVQDGLAENKSVAKHLRSKARRARRKLINLRRHHVDECDARSPYWR